jgi:uncharacterized protein
MQLKLSRYTVTMPAGPVAYLFNTFSGATIVLGLAERLAVETIFADIAATGESLAHAATVGLLCENGFLVPADTDEIAVALEKYDQGRGNPDVVSLTIATTMECNMGCYYCFEDRTSSERLQSTDIDAIVQFASDRLPPQGALHVTWFGGEPLLAKDFVLAASKALIELAASRQADYSASMVSNGYHLDASTVKQLRAHQVRSLQITLDGQQADHDKVRRHLPVQTGQLAGSVLPIRLVPTQTAPSKASQRVGSYDTIISNIARASDLLAISIRVNVSRRNAPSIRQLIDDLAAAGLAGRLGAIYFAPLYNFKVTDPNKHYQTTASTHFSMREFAVLEAELLAHAASLGFFLRDWANPSFSGCIAVAKNGYVIDSNGQIKKCDHELGEPDTELLSLREPSLHNEAHQQLWDDYRPEDQVGCSSCVLLPLCYSHCPHKNMSSAPEELDKCPAHKYNWERTLPLVLAQRIARSTRASVSAETLPLC